MSTFLRISLLIKIDETEIKYEGRDLQEAIAILQLAQETA